jgi:hypothetical protein
MPLYDSAEAEPDAISNKIINIIADFIAENIYHAFPIFFSFTLVDSLHSRSKHYASPYGLQVPQGL